MLGLLFFIHVPEFGEDLKMLARRHVLVEDVVLRTDTDSLPDGIHILSNVLPKHEGIPTGGLSHPDKHVDGAGLPGTVVPEKREDFLFVNCEIELVDS